ncbi:hypothetical protein [Chitinophaga agri]|uniref:Uncharacterized protein n=1 Tax=Chitinophaga agri TaxID=2703787 RepID=A0A6B9ZIP3_9BACT|nr:hypothetical protein [Chitinophaga agri]QHS60955.1 hypothetical protein GWR21_15540 [Chitinophaga agri]
MSLSFNRNIFYMVCVIVLVPLTFISAFRFAKWLEQKKMDRIVASNTRTVAYLISLQTSSKGRQVLAEYYVDNVKYVKRQQASTEFSINDAPAYEILYDSKHPQDSWIDFTRPVNNEADIIRTIATIEMVTDGIVSFSYEVDGEIRHSKLPLPRGKVVKKGEEYPLEYPADNPWQVILDL